MTGIRRALVTGASGFIGTVLCRILSDQNVSVMALMRSSKPGPWAQQISIDLSIDAIPPKTLSGIDTVFHLAGKAHAIDEARSQESEYQQINVEGTRKVLEASVAAGVRRFVLFSTVKAMGEESARCSNESIISSPDSDYGKSKLVAERLVLEAGHEGGFHAVVLRLPLVYGPAVKGNLAAMLAAIAQNRFPPINVTANKRSMIHVEDVARAAVMVVTREQAAGQIYIVTDGEPYSTTRLYELMCAALNKSVPIWHVPVWVLKTMALFGDLYRFASGRRFVIDSQALRRLTGSAWYSSEKIERELGFRPSHHLRESVMEMVGQGPG